jgi:hypothetical protein
MKRLNSPLLIIILLTLLAAIGGVLGNAVPVPPFPKDNATSLFGSWVAITVLVVVIQYLQGQKSFLSSFSSEFLPVTHANIRGRLLQKVQRDWLDEYVGRYVFTKQVLPVEASYLREWLAQELQTWYQVSLGLAQFWIETGQVLPLLDDFDVVTDTARVACIEAINAYHQQHGLIPLVVCSRCEEYLTQPVRFHLRYAVVLQPLSSSLIEQYIVQEHRTLKPIRTLLKRYP